MRKIRPLTIIQSILLALTLNFNEKSASEPLSDALISMLNNYVFYNK